MSIAAIDLSRHRHLSGADGSGRAFDRLAAFAVPYLARRRRRQDLAGLPDHILRDIGVDPEAIRGADYSLNMALLLNNMR